VFVVIVSVFTFAILAAVLGIVASNVDTAFTSLDPNTPGYTEATTITGTFSSDWGFTLDWIVLCVAFGLPLISAILAYTNNIPNIFFFLSIGLLFIAVFLGWGLQWGAEGIFTAGNSLGTYMAANMTGTYWLLSHFGIYSMFAFLIIGLGTYVRTNNGGYYGSGF